MTDTKHEYGWYMADGGSYGGNGGDPWQLIEEAVESEADLARDHDREPQWDEIMIGPIKDALPSDYLYNDDDIRDALDTAAESGPRVIVDLVAERHSEVVYEGNADADATAAETLKSLLAQTPASDIANMLRAWADQHISLDPDRIVEGDHALPVMRIRGEWVYGRHGTPEGLEATVMPELSDSNDGAEARFVWSASFVGFDEGPWIEAESLSEAKRAVDVALASAEAE